MLFKLLQKTDSVKNLVLKGVFVTIFFWLPFNANFFPQLLSYQGGQNLAKEANKLSLNNKNLFMFNNELTIAKRCFISPLAYGIIPLMTSLEYACWAANC